MLLKFGKNGKMNEQSSEMKIKLALLDGGYKWRFCKVKLS